MYSGNSPIADPVLTRVALVSMVRMMVKPRLQPDLSTPSPYTRGGAIGPPLVEGKVGAAQGYLALKDQGRKDF